MTDATNLHRKPLAAIRCRDAARVEIGCDGTARCAASLDAALDVRAQRLSPRGRPRPIDLGLLWIAELDATGFGGGQRIACALADHASLMLGSGGEHCAADDRENPRARR
jgi:hypothetical protein